MEGEATLAGPSAGSQQLKPHSSSKSKVWKFFGFTVDESGEITDKTRVVCNNNVHLFLFSMSL